MSRVFAIVPAAGRSRRMGQPKQLMPIDGRPMLTRVLDALVGADLSDVVLVANSQIVGEFSITDVVINDDEQTEMIDSIRLGLRELDRLHTPHEHDGILICPGDQPNVSSNDIARCVKAFRGSTTSIVIATHAGKRGHPMIFPRTLADDVHSSLCDSGLNALPRNFATLVREVECDASAIQNVNTVEDYRKL